MDKDCLQVSPVQFQGKFILPKISSKAVKTRQFLNDIISVNAPMLKPLPFDVTVLCKNPSKKAINPKFLFYIEKEGYNSLNVFYGRVKVEKKDENPSEKVKNFILNFNEQYKKHKKMKPMSFAERFCYAINRTMFDIKSIFEEITE